MYRAAVVQQRGREGGGAAGSSGAGGGAAAAAPLCTGPGRGMGRGGGEGARAPPLGVSSGGPGDGRPAPVARLRRALPAPSLHMPPCLPACAGPLRGTEPERPTPMAAGAGLRWRQALNAEHAGRARPGAGGREGKARGAGPHLSRMRKAARRAEGRAGSALRFFSIARPLLFGGLGGSVDSAGGRSDGGSWLWRAVGLALLWGPCGKGSEEPCPASAAPWLCEQKLLPHRLPQGALWSIAPALLLAACALPWLFIRLSHLIFLPAVAWQNGGELLVPLAWLMLSSEGWEVIKWFIDLHPCTLLGEREEMEQCWGGLLSCSPTVLTSAKVGSL